MLCLIRLEAQLPTRTLLCAQILTFNKDFRAHFDHPNDLKMMRADNSAGDFIASEIAVLIQDDKRRYILNIDNLFTGENDAVSFQRYKVNNIYYVQFYLGKKATVEKTFFRIEEIVAIIRKINDLEKEKQVDMSLGEIQKLYPKLLFSAKNEIAKFHTGDYAKEWLTQYNMKEVQNNFRALNEMTYEQWSSKQNEDTLKIEINLFCENWFCKALE